LDLAMQATMALPGLFAAPVAEGRVLVDGGTADTLPVDWAYALQPGPVLAVDVAAPYQLPADRLGISEIVSRAEQYSTHTLATLRAETVPAFHVRPDTRDVPFFGFRDYDHLVDVGRRAMENALAAFEAYLDAAV
jgi:NTE family protein